MSKTKSAVDTVNLPKCWSCGEVISHTNMFDVRKQDEYNISGFCDVCFEHSCFTPLIYEEIENELESDDILKMVSTIDGVMLGGGYFRKLVDKSDELCDYDVFFTDTAAIKKVKSHLETIGYKQVFACPKGELFTYKKDGSVKVQLVTKFIYSGLVEMINSFDITACCAGWDGKMFECNRRFIFDVKSKVINLNKVTFPVATMSRIAKYIGKGYTLTPKARLEFVLAVNGKVLDENNMALYVD